MMLGKDLEATLQRALTFASERHHEYATIEHLLLALVDDQDAERVLRGCAADIEKLHQDLLEFLDKDLSGLASEKVGQPIPTAGFQRIVQRAVVAMEGSGRSVTGADVLVALFSERESHAVYFLNLQDITRVDAINFATRGIVKRPGPLAAAEPVETNGANDDSPQSPNYTPANRGGSDSDSTQVSQADPLSGTESSKQFLSQNLEQTLLLALEYASERSHEYATLEHLLLALLDDLDVVPILAACVVDTEELRRELTRFVDTDLAGLATERTIEPKPTAGFQRVVQRAAIHVQASGRNIVTAANVLDALFSERESHAVGLLTARGMTRRDAVNWISHGQAKLPQGSTSFGVSETRGSYITKPPDLPALGVGPHVALNQVGVIAFPTVSAIDSQGNYVAQLHAIYPELRDIARGLTAQLNAGNAPHSALCERVSAYATLLGDSLGKVDFPRVYVAGVRLSNASRAAAQAISRDDLPPFTPQQTELLASLLELHGPFILATASGVESLALEERYQRAPAQERQYREDASALAAALEQRPDLVSEDVSSEMKGIAGEVGLGPIPERSAVIGRSMVRNVVIGVSVAAAAGTALVSTGVVAEAAAVIGGLAVHEVIKQLNIFKSATKSAVDTANTVLDPAAQVAADGLQQTLRSHSQFVIDNQPLLRRLAGNRAELSFMHKIIDWIVAHGQPPNSV